MRHCDQILTLDLVFSITSTFILVGWLTTAENIASYWKHNKTKSYLVPLQLGTCLVITTVGIEQACIMYTWSVQLAWLKQSLIEDRAAYSTSLALAMDKIEQVQLMFSSAQEVSSNIS